MAHSSWRPLGNNNGDLPTLQNPATEQQLLYGYSAIDQSGNILRGRLVAAILRRMSFSIYHEHRFNMEIRNIANVVVPTSQITLAINSKEPYSMKVEVQNVV